MKTKTTKIFEYLLFIIIPLLSVLFCRVLKIAQGEKNEELVIGIMIGLILDLIYFIVLSVIEKHRKKQ